MLLGECRAQEIGVAKDLFVVFSQGEPLLPILITTVIVKAL